jgi:arylsulfatase A-like enzyme
MKPIRIILWIITLISANLELYSDTDYRPNIVVILADDLGYSDIGCFGGEVETPNLDRLAANGVRHTNFYNTSKCWTTRASLLTGQYWQRVTVGNGLKPETITIADRLKEVGYKTCLSGKWHLDENRHEDATRNPLAFGFDKYFGNLHGAVSYFNPYSLMRGTESAEDEIDEDFYLTDAISEDAELNVRNHFEETPDLPLFLYVAYTAPHWPLQALPEDIAKYESYYQGKSFDEIRRSRFQKMQQLGVLPENGSLSEPSYQAWSDVDQALSARRMAVYAAMIDCMDRGIGKIVTALEDTGQLDNTIICFFADNGACPESIGYKNGVDCLGGEAVTRDGHTVSIAGNEMPGDETTFQGYGPDWANVSNTPYRWWKATSHEGGIRSPLIIQWPVGIPKDKRGTVDLNLVSHLIDLSPTFLELAGGEGLQTMDGISLVDYWKGVHSGNPRRVLLNEFGKGSMIFDYPWKLVTLKGDAFLFNIQADPSETRDIASQNPQRFEAMCSALTEWKQSFKE